MDILTDAVKRELREQIARWYTPGSSIRDLPQKPRAAAASGQLAALRTLEAQGRLDSLPEKLLQTALLRREHPEATLSELAELHEPPTSKSTVNHRMRKLLALAAEGTETTEEGPA